MLSCSVPGAQTACPHPVLPLPPCHGLPHVLPFPAHHFLPPSLSIGPPDALSSLEIRQNIHPALLFSCYTHLAGRKDFLVRSFRGGKGRRGSHHFMGSPLTWASSSHPQTFCPSQTWDGRLCLRPGSREGPHHRALGGWGRPTDGGCLVVLWAGARLGSQSPLQTGLACWPESTHPPPVPLPA